MQYSPGQGSSAAGSSSTGRSPAPVWTSWGPECRSRAAGRASGCLLPHSYWSWWWGDDNFENSTHHSKKKCVKNNLLFSSISCLYALVCGLLTRDSGGPFCARSGRSGCSGGSVWGAWGCTCCTAPSAAALSRGRQPQSVRTRIAQEDTVKWFHCTSCFHTWLRYVRVGEKTSRIRRGGSDQRRKAEGRRYVITCRTTTRSATVTNQKLVWTSEGKKRKKKKVAGSIPGFGDSWSAPFHYPQT